MSYQRIIERFSFIDQCLKGIGQIMLQENAVTGLLFLIGIFVGSVEMGFATVISVCTATYTARYLKYDINYINKGLYGFNAALTGAALLLFYKATLIIWCFVIIGAIITTIFQHFFLTKKLPVFTLPFVLLTWILIFFIKYFNIGLSPEVTNTYFGNDYGFSLRGYGQVIFQDNIISGILFFIAVFISAPVMALYGLAGAIAAVFISSPFSVSAENINSGLVGYNGVLCAIVFAGNKIKDGVWALFSVVLATIISQFMFNLSFPQLTLPFVLASIITLMLKKRLALT